MLWLNVLCVELKLQSGLGESKCFRPQHQPRQTVYLGRLTTSEDSPYHYTEMDWNAASSVRHADEGHL